MADLNVTGGNAVVCDIEVTNRGDVATTADITLDVDGTTENTDANVTIGPDETYSTVLYWPTVAGDAQMADYDVCVETTDSSRNDCITVNVS